MQIRNSMAIIAAALAFATNVSAQSYPSVDENGNKIYYKIVSANPEYENMCLEDNSKNASKSDYKFVINDCASDNQYQEWELIADASSESSYYLRNRKSRRYINAKGTWVDNYYSVESAVTKQTTKPYEFVTLDKDQIALKINDGSNDRYLGAVDSAQSAPTFNSISLADSHWAWYVANQDGTPLSVDAPVVGNSVDVDVQNGKIIVTGTNNYEIYDIEGRCLDKNTALLPGIYIVKAGGAARKVAVE